MLYSDRNLINRRTVRADVSKDVSACKKFFLLELEARIVAATMVLLEMEDIDDTPSLSKLNVNIESAQIREKISIACPNISFSVPFNLHTPSLVSPPEMMSST
jgi:hypothetical protein